MGSVGWVSLGWVKVVPFGVAFGAAFFGVIFFLTFAFGGICFWACDPVKWGIGGEAANGLGLNLVLRVGPEQLSWD